MYLHTYAVLSLNANYVLHLHAKLLMSLPHYCLEISTETKQVTLDSLH